MAKIKINGVEYDAPDASTFTLNEWKLVYDESGLTPDRVEDLEDTFHPGWIKSLLMIAVMRARPDLKRREIAETVGKLTIPDMTDVFAEAADADPPTEEELESGEPSELSGETGTDGTTADPVPASLASSGPPASATTSDSSRLTSVG